MITDELIRRALTLIGSSPANYEYFFGGLTKPDWIEPLRNQGRFKNPPDVRREGEYIRFPTWPESQYLVRMAGQAPQLVHDVILEARSTDNVRVHQDYVEAALRMPANLAADIAKYESGWIRTQRALYTLYPEKVGELISHLAKQGASGAGLELAHALLHLSPDPRGTTRIGEGEEAMESPPEPVAKFDQWHYQRILKLNIPDLVQSEPDGAFELLCDLLEAAVKIHSYRNQEPGEDYSWIWRPNIGHGNNYDLKEILVSAVRDAAIQVSTSPEKTAPIVSKLLTRKWRVFLRIGAHLLWETKHATPELVSRLLSESRFLTDFPSALPELAALLEKRFSDLPENSRKRTLEIIKLGPELQAYKKNVQEKRGYPPTEQEVQEVTDSWRLRWLFYLQNALPVEWQTRYDELVAKHGKPSAQREARVSGAWVGPTSPKTVEGLRALTPEELVAFLKTWEPTGEWASPTMEGLGRDLTAFVASDALRISGLAEKMIGLDPTYVRSVIDGLREAVRSGLAINWRPVLNLCEWVSQRRREIPGRKVSLGDADPDWSWAWTATSRLLNEGFIQSGAGEMPIENREMAWRILAKFCEEPDETADEDDYPQGNFVGVLSLNSLRGVAMEAVVHYGLWVRRLSLKELPKEAGAFDGMPELRNLLERHLDQDLTVATWEVFGKAFPSFVFLDRGWTKKNVGRIFQKKEKTLGEVAWANHVMFCRPHYDVLPIIKNQYELAIQTIGKSFRARIEEIDRRLVEHLMAFFWNGHLGFEEEQGLLREFFKQAPAKIRALAVETLGRWLYEYKDTIPPEVLARLQAFWESRIEVIKQTRRKDEELVPFGWWFASGKFDTKWAMRNLIEVLRLCHQAELDHLVVERLAQTVKEMPTESAEALGMIIEGDQEGWSIYGWQDHPRTILKTALESGNKDAESSAKRVINLMGQRGHWGFRDLLKH